ncbi:MAG: hypothetical protein ACRYG8_05670 [Janthinobacterium lividum]
MAEFRPATREELLHSIRYALCFDRRGKSTRRNADFMAQMAAEAMADMLDQAEYVIMKKPPTAPVDVRTGSERKLT